MRDHNDEYEDNQARKYAYDFDAVVRGYMMQTFTPYFPRGRALEIGCFDGASTSLFAERYDDLSVLEAADELIAMARKRVPATVKFIHGSIEKIELDAIYDAIFLVHTLEHIDDAAQSLAKIRRWLTPTGRLFVVVPNADAPSRQIAVRMGLIPTRQSVTEGERQHGHRRTYSFDTLEFDVRAAGLHVLARGGIFFKPFANFQFDLLIKSKIIDQAYLDGCYALGMCYPQLTSSIYVICTRD